MDLKRFYNFMKTRVEELEKHKSEFMSLSLCDKDDGEEESYFLTIFNLQQEEFDAMKRLREEAVKKNMGHMRGIASETVFLEYRENNVCITISSSSACSISDDTEKIVGTINKSILKKFLVFKDGNFLCVAQNDMKWPCTLSDLFGAKEGMCRDVIHILLEFFATGSYLWKGLMRDYELESSYASIPISEVFECRTKAELIERHYGISNSQFNAKNIGTAIFICKISKLVKKEDVKKLFQLNTPKKTFYGNNHKNDFSDAIVQIIKLFSPHKKPVLSTNGITYYVDEMLEDGVHMAIQHREKIPLTFGSSEDIFRWYYSLEVKENKRKMPPMYIPKNSRFKKLRMPPNCVPLTTKTMVAEEEAYQDFTIRNIIEDVNMGAFSLWSMRDKDGHRTTFVIGIKKARHIPEGYFYIKQACGVQVSAAKEEDVKLVESYINHQTPLPEV